MRILMINSVSGVRSTGRICTEMAERYILQGHDVRIAYGRERVPSKYDKISFRIGSEFDVKINAFKVRCFDNEGFNAKRQTKEFLKWADEYDPDLLWLHNLHGYYVNVVLLFNWIKSRPNMQVKWLLHDCWAFTGHCAYFTMANCNKWQIGCEDCPKKYNYPKSYIIDNSAENYKRKKALFAGVKNMTLITPSKWLADLVKKSFLSEYSIEVVYNTINTDIFKPTQSDFRKRLGLENKKIILGVASAWDERKGLEDFLKLAQMLDETFIIILVGLNEKQIKNLPSNMIGIDRTDSPKELAQIYTAADVFVNPSKEETFGMTTVEALACNTRAIVYKDTACEEIAQQFGGVAVDPNAEAIYREITQVSRKF